MQNFAGESTGEVNQVTVLQFVNTEKTWNSGETLGTDPCTLASSIGNGCESSFQAFVSSPDNLISFKAKGNVDCTKALPF